MLNKSNIKTKIISISSLILLSGFTLFGYTQYDEYRYMTDNFNSIKKIVNEELELYIESILLGNQEKAKLYIESHTDIINEKILEQYEGEHDTLKKDIKNPNENTKLVKILDEYLSDKFINTNTTHNKPFVITLDHIIWNRSLSYNYTDSNENSVISLDNFISNHYNQKLSKIAIESIKNMNLDKNKFIFWEALSNDNPEHKIINKMDISEIIDVYNEEGIESLKSYDILVPAYITDEGDIFGNNDVNSNGHKNNNDKIVIVQRVNVFDALMCYESEINEFKNNIDKIDIFYGNISKIKASNMILCSILSILTLIGSSYIQSKINE